MPREWMAMARCAPAASEAPAMRVTYNYEFPKRLRAGFIGCGGHAYRNILPVFQYVPIELVAVCDLAKEKAEHFQRIFGAQRAYSSHLEMVAKEQLDVVFVVTNYDERGHVRYPGLACDCLAAGIHVWVEKPPVNSLADVERLRAAINKSGKKFAVGFKKMFFPANVRMKQIIQSPEFGRIRSIALRYPQYIPTVEELKYGGTDRARWARRASFLDHLCHPVSLLQYLGGRTDSFYYLRAENGAGFALFTLRSGAAAAIHFSTSQSRSSPLERTEVTGDGANVVVDNNMRLTYYRPVRSETFRQYGRGSDFTGDLVEAPLVWEPEFSLGNLYNKGIFLLGYYNEIKHFCDAVLENREVDLGNIDDAEEGIRIYEAFAQGPKRLLTI